eukprot:354874-Chlamydomonas_euryale.AAC.4
MSVSGSGCVEANVWKQMSVCQDQGVWNAECTSGVWNAECTSGMWKEECTSTAQSQAHRTTT